MRFMTAGLFLLVGSACRPQPDWVLKASQIQDFSLDAGQTQVFFAELIADRKLVDAMLPPKEDEYATSALFVTTIVEAKDAEGTTLDELAVERNISIVPLVGPADIKGDRPVLTYSDLDACRVQGNDEICDIVVQVRITAPTGVSISGQWAANAVLRGYGSPDGDFYFEEPQTGTTPTTTCPTTEDCG